MAKRKVLTTKTGRPYVITSCGCPRFISVKEAQAAGWSPTLPLPKPKSKPKKRGA